MQLSSIYPALEKVVVLKEDASYILTALNSFKALFTIKELQCCLLEESLEGLKHEDWALAL